MKSSAKYLSGALEAADSVPGRFHLPHDPDHVPVGQLGQVLLRPIELLVLEEGGEEVGVLGRVLQTLGKPVQQRYSIDVEISP